MKVLELLKGLVGDKRFQFNKKDLVSLIKSAAIAGTGAAIIYILEGVFHVVDFGQFTPIAVAAAAFLANTIRKWLANNT